MFRANTVGWFNLVASLLVGAACFEAPLAAQQLAPSGGSGALPPLPNFPSKESSGSSGLPAPIVPFSPGPDQVAPVAPGSRDSSLNPLQGRPAQAHSALNRAIESQRRGDFEAASPLFQEAQRRQSDLTATEQSELARLMQDNSVALRARRDGNDNLRLAEKAFAENHNDEARECLKKVALDEQYLTPNDRARFLALFTPTRSRPEPTLAMPPKNPEPEKPPMDPVKMAEQARERLKAARQQLTQLQFESAEQIAQEVDHLNLTYKRGDDTPQNVIKDVVKARSDPKVLLSAARAALQRQDYDQAERYANLSSQIGSSWSLNPWGDTPAKVLKDLGAARAKAATQPLVSPFPKDPSEQAQNTPAPKEAGGMFGMKNLFGGKSKPEQQSAPNDARADGQNPAQTNRPGDSQRELPDNRLPLAVVVPPPLAPPGNAPTLADLASGTGAGGMPGQPGASSGNNARNGNNVNQDTALVRVNAGSSPNPQTEKQDRFGPPPSSRPPDNIKEPASDETDQARSLVVQARTALQQGNLAQARKLNEQARMLRSGLFWWEDNPSRVAADIARKEGELTAARHETQPGARPAGKSMDPKEEALALLRQGRTQLNDSKIDEATQTLFKIQALGTIRWGLFDFDNSDKLREDIEKARVKRDQDESVRVLTEARRLFDKGDYDNAIKAAYRAQKLHGTYSRWDIGDRPSKLMTEIELAKQKQYKPFGGNNTTVANNAVKPDDKGLRTEVKPANPQAPVPVSLTERVRQARQYLADARLALQKNDLAQARLLADHVRRMSVVLNQPGEETPETIYRDLDRMARGQPIGPGNTVAPVDPNAVNAVIPVVPKGTLTQVVHNPDGVRANVPLPTPPLPTGPSAAKAQAQMLVAQARLLQKDQKECRLAEARTKALEAQRLGAPFGPEEDSPELVLQQLASQARQRADFLLKNATEVASYGKGTPAQRFGAAEQCLLEARAITLAFGQDLQAIDSRMQWLAELRASGNQAGTATVRNDSNPPPNLQRNQGQVLLGDARRELNKGNTTGARIMAIEACQESYGVREEALALIRNIDIDDNNHRILDARRAFDAAQQAYNRRDYNYAASVLAVIDPRLLDDVRRDRLKNIMNSSEMAALVRTPIQRVGTNDGTTRVASGPGTNPGANIPGSPLAANEGNVHVTDQPKPSLLEATQAMREVKFQALRKQGLDAQSEAAEKFRVGQTDEALDVLQKYLNELVDSQLDSSKISMLRRPVESRLEQFRLMKTQKDFRDATAHKQDKNKEMMHKLVDLEQSKQKKVADLMKQFNELYKAGKYVEAESRAKMAMELDPDNGVAAAAIHIAHNQKALTDANKIKKSREDFTLEALNHAEEAAPADVVGNDISFDKEKWNSRINNRKPMSITSIRKTDKEREIENRLRTPVNLNFTETPLRQVLDDLRNFYGINIWTDDQALLSEGINLEHRVTVKLEQISLRSALTLLLKGSRLTFHIKDEVLQVTTETEAIGKLVTASYLVADLVIPVENFGAPNTSQLSPTGTGNNMSYAQPSPLEYSTTLMGGSQVGQPSPSPSQYAASSMVPNGNGNVTRQNAKNTQERMLIDLITKIIAPNSWSETKNGAGSIDYHPLTMALVVNQSPDIQEQIADLLAALRRLQDQEVAVEVKVVSISDDFYEVIGVNFNINLPTNSAGLSTAIANGYRPSKLIAGITPAGNLTNDLSIPITNNSFSNAFLPFFSGPQVAFPGLGGVQMGLAFLSDIQVFLFMEAAQSDRRTNVMQAPKITLFNGQTATVAVTEQSPYVANVIVLNVNGQVIFQPQIVPLNTGVQLQIQAVISADRRFVRMSLQPTFNNIAVPGPPNLFPITVPVFPTNNLPGQGPNPIVFTQYIQQQAIQTITVGTTVAVPDGGTVVMGGLKTVSESRSEYGPPILSKIPYINRLFKNVSYGRESSSLLIMVTPRIIIMEEEQEYQTGYRDPINSAGGAP